MGIFSIIKEKISSFFSRGEKPIDRSWIQKSVTFWNTQKFGVGKYGNPIKPKTSDLRKVNEKKMPSVRAYRPTLSATDKKLLTVVKIKGRDRRTQKTKTFTMTLGHEKIMSVEKIKEKTMSQKEALLKSGDMPEEYEDIDIEEIVPIIGFLNVNAFPEYQDVLDELNPAYFE